MSIQFEFGQFFLTKYSGCNSCHGDCFVFAKQIFIPGFVFKMIILKGSRLD